MKGVLRIITIIGGAALAALSFLIPADGDVGAEIRIAVFVFGIIITFVGVALCFSRREKPKQLLPKGAEYRRKNSIMTAPEIELYWLLRSSVDERRHLVLPQTALASVVDKVSGGGYRSELFRLLDFCIVDAVTFTPLLAIELNDASHLREDRKLRDEKVSAVCADAGLLLLTFSMEQARDERTVRNEVRKRL